MSDWEKTARELLVQRDEARADDQMHQEVLGQKINDLIERNKALEAEVERLFPTEDSARDAVFAGAWIEWTTETKDESLMFRARLRYPDEENLQNENVEG